MEWFTEVSIVNKVVPFWFCFLIQKNNVNEEESTDLCCCLVDSVQLILWVQGVEVEMKMVEEGEEKIHRTIQGGWVWGGESE